MKKNMNDLVKYIDKFKPNFSSCISGASQDDINILQQLVDRPLPKNYINYLSYFGIENGGLYLIQSGEETNIQEIIKAYQQIQSGEWSIPPNSILICVDIFPSLDLVLQDRGEEMPVLLTEGELDIKYYAASLEGLLFRRAFIQYAIKSLKEYSFWTNSQENIIESAKNLAKDLGFQEQWFTDKIVYCGERNDVLIAIKQHEEEGCGIYLSAQDESEHERIGKILEKEFNFRKLTGN